VKLRQSYCFAHVLIGPAALVALAVGVLVVVQAVAIIATIVAPENFIFCCFLGGGLLYAACILLDQRMFLPKLFNFMRESSAIVVVVVAFLPWCTFFADPGTRLFLLAFLLTKTLSVPGRVVFRFRKNRISFRFLSRPECLFLLLFVFFLWGHHTTIM
jgi:hypothetical protein